jgi:macrolide transport system ATP-binding/permease protein
MSNPLPPIARWLLRLAAPPDHRDALLLDLDEEATARAAAEGWHGARRWSRRQILASLGPLLLRRVETGLTTLKGIQMRAWRGFGADLAVAGRRLREAPGFTLVCVLTLALGIGGNTAVFTLIDRVLLKPLPVPRPSELFRVGETDACCVNSGVQGSFSLFSYDLYTHLRDASPEFTHLAAFQANTRAVTIGRPDADAPAETLNGAYVSGNYFELFELSPAAGRLIHPDDDVRGATPVGVLSHSAWSDRFQARTDIVGRTVTLNGVTATIVGVAPQGFYGENLRPNPPDIWMPLSGEPLLQPAARLLDAKPLHWLYAIGRLKPGVAVLPLQARLTAALQHWLATVELTPSERAEVPRQRIAIIPAAAGIGNMRAAVGPSLRLLQGLAAAVLLIACANLASLLLARGAARRTEMAMRVALGASRMRLIGQLLIESILLACIGGAAGLVVSIAAARAIVELAFRGATTIPVDPSPSGLVIGFAFGASLLTGALFGAAPAIIGSRSDPIDALRGAARTTGDRGGGLRGSLISLQVALSLVLITCAGLLGRSLAKLESQDFGVRLESRYVAALAPSLTTVDPEELASMYARMQERLVRIPGVRNAAFSLYPPMSGDNWSTRIVVEGAYATERLAASWNRVSPRYFETVGTPLLRGRAFDQRDRAGSPLVAIVSQSFAKRHFGDADPIGRRIGQTVPEIEIVGVVGDAKYQDGRRPPREMFFLPYLQETAESRARAVQMGVRIDRSHYPQAIEIHTDRAVAGLESDLRRAMADVDRRITIRSMLTMNEQVAGAFNLERLIARLTGAFGLVAVMLACVGLYGVTAYSVVRRTREIGVRMAVGAAWPRVVATVLRSAVVQVMIGAAVGVPAALLAGRFLQARLFGISPYDPPALAAGVALLGLSAAIAALIPAGRAARTDPVRALRVD